MGEAEWARNSVTGYVDITRLTDGRIMCCLCFEYKTREELCDDPIEDGIKMDCCQKCVYAENKTLGERYHTMRKKYDAAIILAEGILGLHARMQMSSPEDKALHAESVETFQNLLNKLKAID